MNEQQRPTLADFDRVFHAERENFDKYPEVAAVESLYGYSLATQQLERAARDLACPVKVNPPNWQHGRVLYAIARHIQARPDRPNGIFLDIGTAKGFSAVCMALAVRDSTVPRSVVSVDKVGPLEQVYRNSRREAHEGRPLTVYSLVEYMEAGPITFLGGGSEAYFRAALTRRDSPRILLAFIDGKHDYEMVRKEAHWAANFQESGDVLVFDDLQLPAVAQAVEVFRELHAHYSVRYVDLAPTANRKYAIAVRR